MNKFIFTTTLLGALIFSGCTPVPASPVATATEPASPTPAAAWQILNTTTFSQIAYYGGFNDKPFGITVGFAGEIHYTADGGASWVKAQNSTSTLSGLDIVNSDVAWSCGDGAKIIMSADGGKTWHRVTNYGPLDANHSQNQCRFLSFLDANTGWAATPVKLGLTTDGGQTWKDLTLPEGIQNIMAISLRTSSDGYILDAAGKLFTTTDGGQSWAAQSLDFAQRAFFSKTLAPTMAMHFTDEKHGLIVLPVGDPDSGFLATSAYTADGGATWQVDPLPIETGVPSLYLSHDGRTLTVLDQVAKTINVLRFQKP